MLSTDHLLTDLRSPYRLPDDAKARFERDGFVHLTRVLSPDALARYGPAITDAVGRLNAVTTPLGERSTYGRAFLQVMNLWRHDEAVREFVFSGRLARIAAELLGVRAVRLWHDQALYKEPGGGVTPAHADQYYWPFATDRAVTAWVPLQATPREMGPLAFYAGSQHVDFGRDLPISDESEARITADMQARGFTLVNEPFDPGDASFHLGWTFHRAGENRSDRPRAVMTVIYIDADMRLAPPTNRHQEGDRTQWCPDVAIGAPIAGALNPVLWPA